MLNKPILAEELENKLHTKLLGQKVFAFETLSSTNDFAKRLSDKDAQEGTLVLANAQTKGRGTRGRNWHAPPGLGLWFSIILKPTQPAERFGLVSLLAAVALAKTIEQMTSLRPALKWPNDVLTNSKKVSGILIESLFAKNNRHASLILGIGVNVNQKKADFPAGIRETATSLSVEILQQMDRIDFLIELLHNLERFYFEFLNGNTDLIINAWKQRCPFLGQYVSVKQNENEIEGMFENLDEYGRLALRQADGEVKYLSVGEPNLIQRGESCYS